MLNSWYETTNYLVYEYSKGVLYILEFKHKSVLLDECIEGLNIKENGIYIDGTLRRSWTQF